MAGRPHYVDGSVPRAGIDSTHDAADVVLHCKLGQIQIGSNFLVGQSVGHELDELELPGSQGFFIAELVVGEVRARRTPPLETLN